MIYKWKKQPAFIKKMQESHDEFVATHQARAMRDTTHIVQSLSVKVREGLAEVLKDPDKRDKKVMTDFREFGPGFMKELRMFKDQQRADFGLANERKEISIKGGLQVVEHRTHRVTFEKYLEESGKVIEIPKTEAANPAEALTKGIEKLLLTTNLADEIHQEDRTQEALTLSEKGPKR